MTDFEKLLQDTLGDLDGLSPEKIERLVQEALKMLSSLQEKSKSADQNERNEALQTALSLKTVLQKQAEAFSKSAGINPQDLASLAQDESLFSEDMLKELNIAKGRFEALQKSTHHNQNKAAWLHG